MPARPELLIRRELKYLLHQKERPGVFTRPNLHKTPTRLRPFEPSTGAGFWASSAKIASVFERVQIDAIRPSDINKTNLVLSARDPPNCNVVACTVHAAPARRQ
jgi:hypothetical protein